MTKIIHLFWNPYLKLLHMPRNIYRKILNVLLQNLMRMEHFEIYNIKINLKIDISETTGPIKLKFCMLSVFNIYIMQL